MKQNFFTYSDGRKLSWYETGIGAPLVLLHGWSLSAAAFGEIAEILNSGYRLLIVDIPGHGDSSPAPGHELTALATDIAEWLLEVIDEPVSLAGWSLGGMLALQMASSRMVPLTRLVLTGTTPRFTNTEDWNSGLPNSQVQALSRNLKRKFESTLTDFFKLTFAGETLSLERLRTIRNFAVLNKPLPDKEVTLEFLNLLSNQDQRDVLADINCPVIVMHGTEDQVAPFAAGQYIVENVVDGAMIAFPNVGHAPFWSAPRKFSDVLLEFC